MQISITVGNRIAQAERLPKQGTFQEMSSYSKIKKVLIGWPSAHLTSFRIVEVNGKMYSAVPDTMTEITLSDELVLAYADYINNRSEMGMVTQDEADLFEKILTEAANIQAASEEVEPSDPTPSE